MMDLFERLTLKGYTLARIRKTFKANGDTSLEKYTDIPLLQKMIRICRKELPKGTK